MSKLCQSEITSIRIFPLSKNEFNKQFKKTTYDSMLAELNKHKKFMDKIEPNVYNSFIKEMDQYFKLKSIIRTEYLGQAVSNAWLKMYEMLVYYSDKLNIGKTFTMFGNCELPGAFLSATNHFMQDHFPDTKFDWRACSYMSESANSDNTKLGDHYGIYKNNREKWLMSSNTLHIDDVVNIYESLTKSGLLGTIYPKQIIKNGKAITKKYLVGDVTDTDDIKTIAKSIMLWGNVDLYTSDAGIGVESDYDNQEELTLKLNFGQILSGLATTKIGGTLITKQYTYFTLFNLSLINLLSTMFEYLYICKPLTSRPANSEVYIVGINFKGTTLIERFYDLMDSELFGKDFNFSDWQESSGIEIIDESKTSLADSIKEITGIQIKYLKELKQFYEKYKPKEIGKLLHKSNEKLMKDWIKLNGVKKLNRFIKCN